MTIKNKKLNLQEMIEFETQRIIDAILGESLTHSEEKEQKITAALIKSRGVKAPAVNRKTKDDDDAARKKNRSKSNDDQKLNQQHQEADEEEENPKKKNKSGEEAVFDDLPGEEKETGKREDRTGGKGTSDSPKLKPSRETLLDPSFDDIISNVALIRGGKSAKNPEVRKALRKYYDDMNSAEKRALNVFLLGVAQVLSTIDEPVDPDDADLRMDAKSKVGVSSKNQPSKQPSTPSNKVAKAGTQDNPIVVGESANKSKEFAILTSYRR